MTKNATKCSRTLLPTGYIKKNTASSTYFKNPHWDHNIFCSRTYANQDTSQHLIVLLFYYYTSEDVWQCGVSSKQGEVKRTKVSPLTIFLISIFNNFSLYLIKFQWQSINSFLVYYLFLKFQILSHFLDFFSFHEIFFKVF